MQVISQDIPKCPHCGAEQDFVNYHSLDELESVVHRDQVCGECEKEYRYEIAVDVTYTTTKTNS